MSSVRLQRPRGAGRGPGCGPVRGPGRGPGRGEAQRRYTPNLLPALSLLALCAAPPLAAQSGGILAPPSATVDAPSVNTGAPAEPQAAPAEPLRLSLAQAIRMALENNLDIQIQQADQAIAKESVRRTEGGGTPRAINYSVAEPPTGETLLAMPLLSSTASTLSPTGISPTSTSVPSSFDVGHVLELQHSLLVAPAPFSPGTAVPAFDLNLQGQYAWIRRNPGNSTVTSASATAGGTTTTDNTLGNTTLIKGFATGTSIQLGVNDFVQSFYSGRSSAVPFTHPNAIGLIAQPLLRGAGTANNRRYIAIAKTNRRISEAVLEQQIISTISGVEALYYDLIGFQNAVIVQQQALKAANDLLSDNRQQLAVGRMPPIEVTRAEALVTAAQLALTQAEALQQQQMNILRSLIDPKSLASSTPNLEPLVATEELTSPSEASAESLSQMFAHAWAQRPDIQQAKLQIANGERAVAGAANARRPEIDLYGSFQSRGVIIPGLVPIAGDPTTGAALLDPVPPGGVRSSQVFEAGIQFNLPVQNRVAEADLGADRAQLRQERLRETQLEAQVAAEVRNALIGVATAKQAAQAAAASRKLQQRLLAAEVEKFRAGLSTDFNVIQQQTYLAQAQITEIAAKAAWEKAHVQLDRALGDTLDRHGIVVGSQPHTVAAATETKER